MVCLRKNSPNKLINNKNNKNYNFYYFFKRIFDVFASSIGIGIISPLLIIIWLTIKIEESEYNAVYSQKRLGKNGRIFKIYKFRSMKNDAENILKSNEKLYRKYVDHGYKLEAEEDPRITKIGKFLRKTSLDELPQLFNVLKGDMSFVGPRPIVPDELENYSRLNKKDEFLKMKPGITGVWATSGRSSIGYPERVFLEISYADNHSIAYDLRIILKTFVKVVYKEGAY